MNDKQLIPYAQTNKDHINWDSNWSSKDIQTIHNQVITMFALLDQLIKILEDLQQAIDILSKPQISKFMHKNESLLRSNYEIEKEQAEHLEGMKRAYSILKNGIITQDRKNTSSVYETILISKDLIQNRILEIMIDKNQNPHTTKSLIEKILINEKLIEKEKEIIAAINYSSLVLRTYLYNLTELVNFYDKYKYDQPYRYGQNFWRGYKRVITLTNIEFEILPTNMNFLNRILKKIPLSKTEIRKKQTNKILKKIEELEETLIKTLTTK